MSGHSSPYYSDKYTDDKFEYRHVHVPREWVKSMPKDRTMTEQEWRDLGKRFFFNLGRLFRRWRLEHVGSFPKF